MELAGKSQKPGFWLGSLLTAIQMEPNFPASGSQYSNYVRFENSALLTCLLSTAMLQIFNADSTTDDVVPLIVSDEQSNEQLAETVSQTLARQLHAETEKRFFLEEAIDLLDLETREDSSTLMNVLNLLNRTADTRQILIADRDGQLVESSFCVGQHQPELSIGTVTWLIDQADRACRQHADYAKSFISQLTLDQEILTMPLLGQGDPKRWMIAIGDSKKRRLNDQRWLFESARRLLERLTVKFD